MTSISITEIERGILRLKDRERGAVLRTQFARITGELFAQRVLSFDRQCAEATATYMAEAGLESKHHLADGIIAGTAIVHRLDVATRNTSDFNPQLVCVVDPWKFAG
jgi:predicted nucleic acid-binding protein